MIFNQKTKVLFNINYSNKYLLILLLISAGLSGCSDRIGLSAPIFEEWEVTGVHDGDTITARRNNQTEKIRLCGIDAPKLSQPLGKESRDKLRSLLGLPKASLLYTRKIQLSIVGRDSRYKRAIGEVFDVNTNPEKFINEEMVSSGMA